MNQTQTTSMSDSAFDGQINFWGRVTVGLGLVFSLAAPIYLFVVEGLFPGWTAIAAAFAGIALIYAANWVVEPATYFPMLGVSGTYQAWLVGNISNKLLPASVTAQAATDTKPGGKKAELISVAAISGAVIVHVLSMVLLVALFGNWIVSVLPDSVVATFDYILPAIVGAVLVQIAFVIKDPIVTTTSLVLGALVVFWLAPTFPALSAFGLPIVVVGSVVAAILNGSRRAAQEDMSGDPGEVAGGV